MNLNVIAHPQIIPQIGQIEYSFRKPKLTPTQIESRTRKVLLITVLTTFGPHTYDAEAVYGHLDVLKYLKSEGVPFDSGTTEGATEGGCPEVVEYWNGLSLYLNSNFSDCSTSETAD